MTFIDQTIVALAVPELQKDPGLPATGTQWVIDAYLLSLAAGVVLLALFVRYELGAEHPVIQMRIFQNRASPSST